MNRAILRPRFLPLLAGALAGALSCAAQAGESTLLQSPAPVPGAGFGYAVAHAGEWLAIGAPGEDDAAGAVYLYHCPATASDCAAPTRLLAPTRDDRNEFGAALALNDARLVVGSPGAGHGEVDVFRRVAESWVHEARLSAFDGDGGDRFGHALALEDNQLLVGAPRADAGAGAAYAFTRGPSQWTQASLVQPAQSAPGDRFGHALAMHSGRALIAAPLHDPDAGGPGFAQGSVFAFDLVGGWVETQRIQASAPSDGDLFGWSLTLGAARSAIGRPGHDAGRGAVHLFEHSAGTWIATETLLDPEARPQDRLGWQLHDAGVRVLAGLPLSALRTGAGCGRMLSFAVGPGAPAPESLRARLPQPAALFGWSATQAGAVVLVGAPARRDGLQQATGSVLRFDPTLSLQHDGFENGGPSCDGGSG